MASLACIACGVQKPAPHCPSCSTEENMVFLAEKEGKAACGDCGHLQNLPNHCGWAMKIQ